jgi:hypothetical protein
MEKLALDGLWRSLVRLREDFLPRLALAIILIPTALGAHHVQSRLKDVGYAKEVLGGLVLTDDGLRRIAIDRERIRTFVEGDASR